MERSEQGPGDHDRWPARAAVLGGGTMGGGFVQLLALAGVPVALADASAEAAQTARERTIALAADYVARGLMEPGAAERVAEGAVAAASVEEACAGADFVLEAVPEEPGLKGRVLSAAGAAAPSALIATNTSAIPIGELAASVPAPERFLGMHWFNPAQWVPAVEVIPAPATAPEAVERASALLRRLGKEPTVVGDAAGFVANRIQFAMFKEAASVVADGIATPEEVDSVVRSSFGFRLPFYGPFAIADMAGLDVYAGAYGALERAFGPRFAAPPALLELVGQGRLGAKAGGGFLAPGQESAEQRARRRDAAYAALTRLREQLDAEAAADADAEAGA